LILKVTLDVSFYGGDDLFRLHSKIVAVPWWLDA